MDRREFLKLVVSACVASQLPFDKVFAQVSRETNYLDGLIVSMAESADKQTILVKTSRWFTTREVWDVKSAWLDSVYGEHNKARFNDTRDILITSLTDKKPEGAVFHKGDPDGFLSERCEGKWFVDNEDGGLGAVLGSAQVRVLKPEPSVLDELVKCDQVDREWVNVDEQPYEGTDLSSEPVEYRFYHLGPGGSSEILGVYDNFEEWLYTRDSGINGVLEVGIEPEQEKRFVDYCADCGIECHRIC